MKKKRMLITSGSTDVKIDKVRTISNIFKGNTGLDLVRKLYPNYDITYLTSNNEHYNLIKNEEIVFELDDDGNKISEVKGFYVKSYEYEDGLLVKKHSNESYHYYREFIYELNEDGNPISRIEQDETGVIKNITGYTYEVINGESLLTVEYLNQHDVLDPIRVDYHYNDNNKVIKKQSRSQYHEDVNEYFYYNSDGVLDHSILKNITTVYTHNSDGYCTSLYTSVCKVVKYDTYDDLYNIMKDLISNNTYDVIIHSAAVSDYKLDSVMVEDSSEYKFMLNEIDSSSKISSEHNELYLKMVKTEKIVDRIREWGFMGALVKFKLQVDISDDKLLKIAEQSMNDSNANIIVSNCLEWAKTHAYISYNDKDGNFNNTKVKRDTLADNIHNTISHIFKSGESNG